MGEIVNESESRITSTVTTASKEKETNRQFIFQGVDSNNRPFDFTLHCKVFSC